MLAGASGPAELDVLAPLLAGSVDLGPHPFRLRGDTGAEPLEEALSARRHDPGDGAQSPFLVTAGTIAALAGLPRLGVPGLNVTGSAEPGTQRTMSPAPAAPDTPVHTGSPAVGGHNETAGRFPDQPRPPSSWGYRWIPTPPRIPCGFPWPRSAAGSWWRAATALARHRRSPPSSVSSPG